MFNKLKRWFFGSQDELVHNELTVEEPERKVVVVKKAATKKPAAPKKKAPAKKSPVKKTVKKSTPKKK